MVDLNVGKINFRIDKQANLQFVISMASFDEKALAENFVPRWMRSSGLSRRRRAAASRRSSSRSRPPRHGLPVGPSITRNFAEATLMVANSAR